MKAKSASMREPIMGGAVAKSLKKMADPEPAWEIARLFPPQGTWSEEDYLDLATNHLVEFSDGNIEVLPMPTVMHQLMVLYLYKLFDSFVESRQLGRVLVAPLKVRLRTGKFREPDVLFLRRGKIARMGNQYWDTADLVMEVVSDDNRDHDLKKKRREYALAGIPEYWIVDPQDSTITILTLNPRKEKKSYIVHGRFAAGDRATSKTLPGFEVDVTAVFSQQP
jgi:Uma2 family endonuclease